jgi:hypothetical protein
MIIITGLITQLVLRRSLRNYHLVVNAITTQRENQSHVVLLWWSPPPVGWVRLNTDGYCRDGGHIGCGGIIRGSNGEWL